MSYILDIATAVPEHEVKNHELMNFYSKALASAKADPISKKISLLIERTKINKRYSCIPDFNGVKQELFFDGDYNQTVENRMVVCKKKLMPLAILAVDKLFKRNHIHPSEITHLITVNCTGVFAPGFEFLVAEHYAMPQAEKLALNFIGCYAAVKALKHANYIAKAIPSACILIVSVELCSLHFNPSAADEDIIANLLFADGAAAVLVCGDKSILDKGKTVLAIDAVDSAYIPGTEDLMTWDISSHAFNMYLDKNIVSAIRENILPTVNKFLTRTESHPDYWAIHPGGVGIVEAVKQSLSLSTSDVEDSLSVLANYGNMSSPTILFVLKRILDKIQPNEEGKNKEIFACAFGPGLTIEMIGLSAINMRIKKELFDNHSEYKFQDLSRIL